MTEEDAQMRARLEAQNQLRIARADAIQSYAGLEHALCSLFTLFLEAKPDVAATVFYKMANARSRNTILSKLLKKRYGASYNAFWNSLIKIVQKDLDQRRNEIVHWHEAIDVSMNDNGLMLLRPHLTPPNYWDRSESTPTFDVERLNEFVAKCNFATRSLNMFHLLLLGKLEPDSPWHDICRQLVVYPPPCNHPLSRTERES